MKRFMIWSLVLIVVIGALPLISALAASTLAGALGCELNEGSIHPCLLGGTDVGGMLYTMFVLHWFGLMTLPLGGMALVVWLIVAVILLCIRWFRRPA
jgi:hypothetical protein